MNRIAIASVALALAGCDGQGNSAIQALTGGGLKDATVGAVGKVCEMDEGARTLLRETVNAALEEAGGCWVVTCAGDKPAACPRGTRLAETGEPAETDIQGEVAVEKLKAEVEADIREELKDEVEAEVAAEAAEAAAEDAAKE